MFFFYFILSELLVRSRILQSRFLAQVLTPQPRQEAGINRIGLARHVLLISLTPLLSSQPNCWLVKSLRLPLTLSNPATGENKVVIYSLPCLGPTFLFLFIFFFVRFVI
ncbi:hypothetical protein L873DRAFT_1514241 [Choiromyces venosus 120613-1]|uniref:Uncharacterized protein n=1 Tax=Choiromyces venosus 120613-1 TaxID=1336337 RepID=A0A3N4J5Z3_9PEZI|nr:hypothetical protein L873DRAFT_1514241 [Choiromyces venosus 120613-1]